MSEDVHGPIPKFRFGSLMSCCKQPYVVIERQFVKPGKGAAFTRTMKIYAGLDAATDMARLQATFRIHGIQRGAARQHRQATSG